jgi:hypothetical protein
MRNPCRKRLNGRNLSGQNPRALTHAASGLGSGPLLRPAHFVSYMPLQINESAKNWSKGSKSMALTPAQLEKKITDLEKKVASLASSKDLSDAENRLESKIDSVKQGSGGTDHVVLGIQGDISNIKKSISSLIDDVSAIKKKLDM